MIVEQGLPTRSVSQRDRGGNHKIVSPCPSKGQNMPPIEKYNDDAICCAHCQGRTWNAYLDRDKSGLIHLLVCCDNKECAETQRKRYGGDEQSLIVSFDVVLGKDEEADKKIKDDPERLN